MAGDKCIAIRADGSPCTASALLNDEDGVCLWHSERYRDTRLANARKGGLRRTIELPSAEKLTLSKSREILAAAAAALMAGSMDHQTFRSLQHALELNLRLRNDEQLEARLSELETRIESLGTGRRTVSGSNGHRRVTAESLREKRDQLIGAADTDGG